MFGLDDGSSFDPVSVDLAEYSGIVLDPVTVHFVGYRPDGTVLTDDITTAGLFNGVARFHELHLQPEVLQPGARGDSYHRLVAGQPDA